MQQELSGATITDESGAEMRVFSGPASVLDGQLDRMLDAIEAFARWTGEQ